MDDMGTGSGGEGRRLDTGTRHGDKERGEGRRFDTVIRDGPNVIWVKQDDTGTRRWGDKVTSGGPSIYSFTKYPNGL